MRIKLIVVGKDHQGFLSTGISEYAKRLNKYGKLDYIVVPDVRNARKKSTAEIKQEEGVAILKKIKPNDFVELLDEKGKTFTSVQFARHLQKRFNRGGGALVFVIGGPYGFSQEVYQRADARLALSEMTFSHQMIRLFFVEQIYRAMTILKGEPYHHE
ncbi:MAG: 23S rRNA (pseudouridine(1915)-N(3))-methyltransferase RlmH [Bacteroidota bacterium]